jgi:predicted nuclease of predicted toxin-antitoxin system
MILLADESVDFPIVDRLRGDGHSVAYVAEVSPSISDDAVLQQANSQGALLLTADKDFGELVFRHNRIHGGVILIRLLGMLAEIKAEIVAETLRDRESELPGAFTVISPGMVRIRRVS